MKELVIAGILLASRHLYESLSFVKQLSGDDRQRHRDVEQYKKQSIDGVSRLRVLSLS